MAVDASVFTCISMLAKAVGPEIEEEVRDLLEPMLATGLRYDTENHIVWCLLLWKIIIESCQFSQFPLQKYLSPRSER